MRPYREYRPPPRLEPLLACSWENAPADRHVQRVVPDGCIDVIWLGGRELMIAGADTGPRVVELPSGARSSGIRLRPGAAGAVLGVPAYEVVDRQVPAADIWGGEVSRLEEAMARANPAQRLHLLADWLDGRGVVPDALVVAAAHRLADHRARVSDVAAELGLSERQLHRRMRAAVGYGPKTLGRIARLRRLVALTDESLSFRAYGAGYASQAHMNDEVRRLTGTTPVRFLEDAALTAA